MKIRVNDTVLITKGRDRGKTAKVQKNLPKTNQVLIEGINSVFKHAKASATVRQAGIIQKEMPINASNTLLICTHCSTPTKVKFKILADGNKARICSDCKEVIE